jgi:hypothetical protein
MLPNFSNMQDAQKVGQANVDNSMKFFAEWQKNMQTFASELTNYQKRAFEDSTQTFEKLLGVKSVDQAMEIQTAFAKRAYDEYMQQVTKIGGMFTEQAKEAYKPLERAMQQGR